MNNTSSSETWIADPFGRPLDVDWRREGDEWVDHLFGVLAADVPSTGNSSRPHKSDEGIPYHHAEYKLHSDELRSSLRLIPLKQGIYLLVTGEGETAPASQVDPWVRAAEQAAKRVGQTHHDFAWSAVIGPKPVFTSAGQVLQEEAEVGGLRLRPSGVLLNEDAPAGLPSFYAYTAFYSGPAIVTGTARGYSWNAASVTAARQLHRLCALLSVAWDSAWVVRDSPLRDETGDRPVPEYLPPDRSWRRAGSEEFLQTPMSVPEWASAAWDLLDRDAVLADALAAHHQALLLHHDHPSFALLGFVAAVEGVGAKLMDLDRCKTCGLQVGSGKRFRKALQVVLPEQDTKALAKSYTSRSQTAHAGRLHGTEARAGALPGRSFLTGDPLHDFVWGSLYKLRLASRELLVLALTDSLPEKV